MVAEFVVAVTEGVSKVAEASEMVDNVNLKETPVTEVQTIRMDLAGKQHPETGVPYVEKTIDLGNAEIYKGVFPEFESSFEVTLEESQYLESDGRQFRHANNELNSSIIENPDLAKQFMPDQLEQIARGRTPDGYVWHHSETPGVLQLVDKEIHELTRHTGGRALWGGGQEFR
ncbi:MAG: HNH endonuclease [Solibacillus sp.]